MSLLPLADTHAPQQAVAVLAGAILALTPPGQRVLAGVGRALSRLARRRGLALTVLAAFALAMVLLLTLWCGVPRPAVHDEFAYLLQADTFASGRLTNPTPPAWEHFETMHVLLRPSYQAKYPPGQGLALALGQAAVGRPVVGVWLGTVLAVVCIGWALRPVAGPRWALAGGLLAAIHPQVLEWSQSYWGGNLALAGGAMVLGGVWRLQRGWRSGALPAAVAGAGCALLAITRPYEGLVLVLLAGLWLMRRWPRGAWRRAPAALLPGVVVVAAGLGWLGWYNDRVTGSALRLPYVEHEAQYGVAPVFLFQRPAPREQWPVFRNPQMRQFAEFQWGEYARRYDTAAVLAFMGSGLWLLARAAGTGVWPLILPLIHPAVWRRARRWWLPTVLGSLFIAALLAETYLLSHYGAPAGAAVLAGMVILQRRVWRLGAVGQAMVRAGLAATLVCCLFWWFGLFAKLEGSAIGDEAMRNWTRMRDDVARQVMQARPGKHLVLVQYREGHSPHIEWVYNGADLAAADILWARDLGPAANAALLAAWPGRTAWMVCADDPEPKPLLYQRQP